MRDWLVKFTKDSEAEIVSGRTLKEALNGRTIVGEAREIDTGKVNPKKALKFVNNTRKALVDSDIVKEAVANYFYKNNLEVTKQAVDEILVMVTVAFAEVAVNTNPEFKDWLKK